MMTSEKLIRDPEARRYCLDGISLEVLVDRVYHEIGGWLAKEGRNLKCEVITWEPIEVAMDFDAMMETMQTAISWIAATNPSRNINFRAWSGADPDTVNFEISVEDNQIQLEVMPAHPGGLLPIKAVIERMGGCIHGDSFTSCFSRIQFKLIRWVADDLMATSKNCFYPVLDPSP